MGGTSGVMYKLSAHTKDLERCGVTRQFQTAYQFRLLLLVIAHAYQLI